MKKVILLLVVFTGLTAVSCKKENKEGATSPAVPSSMNVEYRISSESGSVNATYIIPGSNGQLEEKTVSINRNYETVNFDYTKGNYFSVEANNSIPSHKSVQVQLYINGVMVDQGVTTSASQNAIANGNF
jgi:hypothetical protein